MRAILDGVGKCKAVLLAGVVALGVTGPAEATTNAEDFMIYETAYLESCSMQHPERICRCSMEMLEERITFHEFAEAVDRTEGHVARDPRWGDAARHVVDMCVGAASATAQVQP